MVDTFSRYVPVVDPRFSYRAEDVVASLERVCSQTGYPSAIRVDQGTEFVSRDLDLWAYTNGVTLDFSRPGKPTDNAFIEAFSGRLRAECLNTHAFMSHWRINADTTTSSAHMGDRAEDPDIFGPSRRHTPARHRDLGRKI